MPDWLGLLIGFAIGLWWFMFVWPTNEIGESVVRRLLRLAGIHRPRAGGEVLPGTLGVIERPLGDGVGRIRLLEGPHRGESWRARTLAPVDPAIDRPGGVVRVAQVRGITLSVVGVEPGDGPR